MKKSFVFAWIMLFLLICLLFWWTAHRNAQAIRTDGEASSARVIVIDPGHGGVDGGAAAADGTLEKDINLAIAYKLNDLFRCAGIRTVMTRTGDDSIHDPDAVSIRQKKVSDIHNRLEIMRQTQDALFISIHQNHFEQSKYNGTQVFFSGNDPRSRALASCIQSAVTTRLQPENTRQIKQSGTEIYLLYHAVRPAVMVECGFLSNVQEVSRLKDTNYQTAMAMCIYAGVLDFFENAEEV